MSSAINVLFLGTSRMGAVSRQDRQERTYPALTDALNIERVAFVASDFIVLESGMYA
jgi:hypothetical protein